MILFLYNAVSSNKLSKLLVKTIQTIITQFNQLILMRRLATKITANIIQNFWLIRFSAS